MAQEIRNEIGINIAVSFWRIFTKIDFKIPLHDFPYFFTQQTELSHQWPLYKNIQDDKQT